MAMRRAPPVPLADMKQAVGNLGSALQPNHQLAPA